MPNSAVLTQTLPAEKALETASEFGKGAYLDVMFGAFILGVLVLVQRHQTTRDRAAAASLAAVSRSHENVMSRAYELLQQISDGHIVAMRELHKSTQDATAQLVACIGEQQRQLLDALDSRARAAAEARDADVRQILEALTEATRVMDQLRERLEE